MSDINVDTVKAATTNGQLTIDVNGTGGITLAGAVSIAGIVSGTDVYCSSVVLNSTANLGKAVRVSGAAVMDVVSLTDGASIAVDFNTAQNFAVTLGGNRTLAAPSNCVAGQTGSIFVYQDGTGTRTLSYNSVWDFAAATAPTMST